MTKRTLEYIANHYSAAVAAWNKCCIYKKCKKCPFANGVYCERTNDMNEDVKSIKTYLKSQKGGKK